MSHYYVADGHVPRGPFAIDRLPRLGLRGHTLVWKPGMPQWRRADRVEELIFAGVLYPVPPAVPDTASASPPPAPVYDPGIINTNRLVAGLCGILLGGFGVHKFVLGMPKAGVIMLLLTVLGGLLTCGTTAGIMGVIGLIEGVLYLTRSDADFYQTYMVQKKQWL
jgi:TM2 domain-containing membrane protein YozV